MFDPYSTFSYTCPGGQQISLRNQVSYNGVANVMNPNQITAVGNNVANLYPAANQPGIADNYDATQKNTNDQDSGDIRIDHNIRESDQVFVAYGMVISAAFIRLVWASSAAPIAARASATPAPNTLVSGTPTSLILH